MSSAVAERMLIEKVQPEYPARAKSQRIEGRVVISVVIGLDGKVHELKVQSGPRFLDRASLDAVRQWRYKPYELEGHPVEVDTTITIEFHLSW